ncbi:MAG: hypothetical protein JWM41_4368 [Gemmatimonadetes bacterium]|nr:hypothetical protein [Gemmatimonadota bacterium]
MLRDRAVCATIAVKDLPAAKRFYEGTLGLTQLSAKGVAFERYDKGSIHSIVNR